VNCYDGLVELGHDPSVADCQGLPGVQGDKGEDGKDAFVKLVCLNDGTGAFTAFYSYHSLKDFLGENKDSFVIGVYDNTKDEVHNPTVHSCVPEAGPQGPVGPAGPQGLAGLNGTDGAAGVSGVAGKDGLAGVSGVQGEVGPAGPASASTVPVAPQTAPPATPAGTLPHTGAATTLLAGLGLLVLALGLGLRFIRRPSSN
jgi:LPXTG-motif cell wall-anchored protein